MFQSVSRIATATATVTGASLSQRAAAVAALQAAKLQTRSRPGHLPNCPLGPRSGAVLANAAGRMTGDAAVSAAAAAASGPKTDRWFRLCVLRGRGRQHREASAFASARGHRDAPRGRPCCPLGSASRDRDGQRARVRVRRCLDGSTSFCFRLGLLCSIERASRSGRLGEAGKYRAVGARCTSTLCTARGWPPTHPFHLVAAVPRIAHRYSRSCACLLLELY